MLHLQDPLLIASLFLPFISPIAIASIVMKDVCSLKNVYFHSVAEEFLFTGYLSIAHMA